MKKKNKGVPILVTIATPHNFYLSELLPTSNSAPVNGAVFLSKHTETNGIG